jgi:hypothetical protein
MNPWIVIPFLGAIAILFVVLPVGGAAYGQFRRQKLVRCPTGNSDAVIRVDPVRAAVAESLGRRIVIAQCSRWPKHGTCGQDCLRVTPWSMRDAPRAT